MNEWNAVLADLYWLIGFTLLITVICNTIKFVLYHYECTFINTFLKSPYFLIKTL